MTDAGEPRGEDPFFVVGTGRCGSTLLQAMLDAHPCLRLPPETQFFDHLDPPRLGLPDPLPPDLVDRYLRLADERGGLAFIRVNDRIIDAYRGYLLAQPRRARDMFLWILRSMSDPDGAAPSGVRLGEKTPQHWQHLDRIRSFFPDAPIVHIHRDPRDVVAGLLEMPWWKQRSVWKTAAYCRQALTDALRRAPDAAQRVLLVRYESLVADPEAQMRRVCEHVGVAYDPAVLSHDQTASRAFLPHESAYKAGTARPLDRGRHGRYRDKLTGQQIRVIERMFGLGLLGRLGYEPDPTIARPVWGWAEVPCVQMKERLLRPFGISPRRAPPDRPTTASGNARRA